MPKGIYNQEINIITGILGKNSIFIWLVRKTTTISPMRKRSLELSAFKILLPYRVILNILYPFNVHRMS